MSRVSTRLRIVIPTFNRSAVITTTVSHVYRAVKDFESVDILILDDGSKDETEKTVKKWVIENDALQKIRYSKNPVNLGFARNFCSIFRQIDSGYFLFLSDDDLFCGNQLNELLIYIEDHLPDFMSPYSVIKGEVYRGIPKIDDIPKEDFIFASSRSSGLIFRSEKFSKYLSDVEKLIDSKNSFVCAYPQAYLLLRILIDHGKCKYVPWQVEELGKNLPTGIRSSEGAPFWAFESRVSQAAALLTILHGSNSKSRNDAFYTALRSSYSKKIAVSDLDLGETNALLWLLLKKQFKLYRSKIIPVFFKTLYRRILN